MDEVILERQKMPKQPSLPEKLTDYGHNLDEQIERHKQYVSALKK